MTDLRIVPDPYQQKDRKNLLVTDSYQRKGYGKSLVIGLEYLNTLVISWLSKDVKVGC